MKDFDKNIKQQFSKEELFVPSQVHMKIEQTLESLPAKSFETSKAVDVKRVLAIAVAIALFFLVCMPNISTVYAQAMAQIPFIGDIMHVFTIRDYSEEEKEENDSGMVAPHIKDEDGIEENKLLSIDEDEITETILKKFYEDMDLEEEDSIPIEYEVLRNTHSSFEMKITINNFTENGDYCIKYYHVDRIHGRYETLQTMMAREGIAAMEAYILQKLESQQIGISENAIIIHEDQNYYYNEAHELIILLNKAELGAGETGYLEVMIPEELYVQYIYL